MTCEMEPGDLLLWTLFTVHGSAPNVSDYDRRFMINSYVRAGDSERGEWTFRDGISTALGPVPQICKYEQLRERPLGRSTSKTIGPKRPDPPRFDPNRRLARQPASARTFR